MLRTKTGPCWSCKWRGKSKEVGEQSHRLLTYLSGTFTDTRANWSVIEKEAFPIATACKKLSYLLMQPRHLRLRKMRPRNLRPEDPPSGRVAMMDLTVQTAPPTQATIYRKHHQHEPHDGHGREPLSAGFGTTAIPHITLG
ncbi:hypothetical protein PHYSODRAFT_476699 [Phytophthora sojae]|uniref:Reverse transcriptase RNase H-like domain-containing protein n=1 Tax=Phytophthora sojae (strain P6497) TaxID=1094619 RepID=G4YHH5_PHYSP|nr:hypothetical protein PHYSODRAFT_476699 [Phytophthora sojae]EGZ28763.1 hypothetical protein PHYSODRAFT_476699 [Phytophthora sojae]|eukprot:XP_009516038.1 hypothetical protein PHYSODRAFT_476699 [Phytophthora sojae]